MKFYWGKHTCAIGIHILLEEAGANYETHELDIKAGETQKPPFIHINPKGKVPTLVRDDKSVLTEFSAIATWIARTYPDKKLLSNDLEKEVRAYEMINYITETIHIQGYGRIFKPELYEPQDMLHGKMGLGQDAVKQQGRDLVEKGFGILNMSLGKYQFAVEDNFTIADAALFYIERWAANSNVTLPSNVATHFAQMKKRPSVIKVMGIWGESEALRAQDATVPKKAA